MMRVAAIKSCRDGLFEFAPDGELSIVADVHDSTGDLADLVAWQPEKPGRWWLRYGDVAVLGAHNLALAAWYGEAIDLHCTPQKIFRTGQRGCCVLLWSTPLNELFDGVNTIHCSPPAVHQRLVTAFRSWEPRVTVREVRNAA